MRKDKALPRLKFYDQPSLRNIYLQAVIRKLDSGWHLRLIDIVIIIMRKMREVSLLCADPACGSERLIQAHVRGMWGPAERIEHRNFNVLHFSDHRVWHHLAVAQV